VRSALEWAQVRALAADGISQREIAERLGMNRRTVARLAVRDEPPRYRRAPAGSHPTVHVDPASVLIQPEVARRQFEEETPKPPHGLEPRPEPGLGPAMAQAATARTRGQAILRREDARPAARIP
jgi:transposase